MPLIDRYPRASAVVYPDPVSDQYPRAGTIVTNEPDKLPTALLHPP